MNNNVSVCEVLATRQKSKSKGKDVLSPHAQNIYLPF